MAITQTHQSDQTYDTPGDTFALTHTVGSGSNRLLLVLVGYENEDREVITSVVWDAVGVNETLTEIGTGYTRDDDAAVYAYYYKNPTAGIDKLITVTLDSSLTDNSGASIVAFSLEGVDQDSPIRQEHGDGDSAATLTATLNNALSGDFIAAHVNIEITSGDWDWTSSSIAMTEIQEETICSTTFGAVYGTSDGGGETITATYDDSDYMALMAVAIKPAEVVGAVYHGRGLGRGMGRGFLA